MGMMARMRSLAPWFIITVGGLFVLFMVLSDSKVTQILGQRSRNVGSVNDYDITYQEYSTVVENARQNQVKQTGKEIDENQMARFRDQVWDYLVNQKLMEQKIKEYGIEVTDDEIRNVIISDDPPAFLKQSFIDSTGKFNRDMYNQAIFDPRNKEALIQAEDQVRSSLLQQKLQNYLFATVLISDDEIKSKYIDDNIRMSAEYALVEYNSFPDSLFNISDEDLTNYYNSHKKDYKVNAKRKAKYVLFRKAPSAADTLAVMKNLEAIVKKLKKDTASFKTYVDIYSDKPYKLDTLAINRIPQAAQIIVNKKRGDVFGPLLTFEGAVVIRYIGKIKTKEKTVRASHILIKSSVKGDSKAKAKADSIYKALKAGADFAETARELSEDFSSAKTGGDLGWFGRGQMVKPFEKACFGGKVNVIQKPVKTRFGYHIIKVTGKTSYKYIIEKIVNKIEASATTTDKLFNDAADFAYLAKEDGFEAAAKMLNYKILETPAFEEDAVNVPGIGSSKALIKFVFNNDIGDISDAFKVAAGNVVVMISDIADEGYLDFTAEKMNIKRAILNEKKKQKAVETSAEIKTEIGENGNLAAAASVYPKTKVDRADNFTAGGNIPKLGKDYAFIDYCLEAEVNKLSDPIKGNRGSFLIKLLNRTKLDSASFLIQKKSIRETLLQRKKSILFNEWLASVKEEADIVDNRYQFYK